MTPKQKRRLQYLFGTQGGRCHWCGRVMISPGQPHVKRQAMNPALCTFDHLDDRFSPERGSHRGEPRSVAACWGCNTRRGKERQDAMPIEVLRDRAKRGRLKRMISRGIAKMQRKPDASI